MKRTNLSRRVSLQARNGIKPVTRSKQERWDGEAWQVSVALWHGTRCAVCGDPAHAAHHVITKNLLKREIGAGGRYEAAIRDSRNGLPLCDYHHDRHHSRQEPLCLSLLGAGHWEFAEEHNLLWWIERTYNQEDET